jgi:hypothetical protein
MRRPALPRETAATGARRTLVTNFGRYDTPEKLAADARLAPAVREKLLREWAEDLTSRLRASDENMPSDEPGDTGEMLRRVNVCLEHLVPPAPQH